MQGESQLTKLTYGDATRFKPLWPITESQPEWATIADVGTLLEFNHEFTWSQDVLVSA